MQKKRQGFPGPKHPGPTPDPTSWVPQGSHSWGLEDKQLFLLIPREDTELSKETPAFRKSLPVPDLNLFFWPRRTFPLALSSLKKSQQLLSALLLIILNGLVNSY